MPAAIRRALSFRRQSQDNAQSVNRLSGAQSPGAQKCYKTATLHLGDVLDQINGTSVRHAAHTEATELLRSSRGTIELIVLLGGLQFKAHVHKESVGSKTGITLSDGDEGPIICALDSSGAALANYSVEEHCKSLAPAPSDFEGKQMWTDMSRGEQIELTAIFDNRWNGIGWGFEVNDLNAVTSSLCPLIKQGDLVIAVDGCCIRSTELSQHLTGKQHKLTLLRGWSSSL